MNVKQITQLCLSYPGATDKLSGHPANIFTFKVGDKKFAYFKTSSPEKWRFSIRVSPSSFLELTDQEGVKPARFMGRFHWITIVNVDTFNDEYLKELIQYSYQKAISSLSKKRQALILSQHLS